MSSLVELANKSFCLSTRSVYKKLEQSAVTKREKIFLDPDSGQGPYTQNQKVVFKFPSTNFLDPTTLHLEFAINFAAATNNIQTDFGLANSCADIIRRVRVIAGSTELIDLDRYNVWCNFNYKTIHNWMNSVTQADSLEGFNIAGYSDTCQFGGTVRTAPAKYISKPVGGTNIYSHQLQCGIFQILQYIPLSLVNDLQLEIYLETNGQALMKDPTSTAAGLSYTVTNLRLYYDQVTFTPEFAASLLKDIEKKGALNIPFYQIRTHERTLAGGLDNFTFQINEKVTSLNQVFVIPLLQTMQNNEIYNSVGCFAPGSRWVSHQFRLNQTYFPPYVIDTMAEWMVNNLIACNQYNDTDSGGVVNRLNASQRSAYVAGNNSATPFANSNWMCEYYGFDFEREKCPDLTSGFDTTSGTSDLEFIIRYDNSNYGFAVTGNKLMIFFCLFDAVLSITPNGITTVSR
jgi:hypothetical protein